VVLRIVEDLHRRIDAADVPG